jgi:hypothetical protein
MSTTVLEIIQIRMRELDALREAHERYPHGTVRGRIYEVDYFRPDDTPDHVVMDNGKFRPCLRIGWRDTEVFVVEEGGASLTPEAAFIKLFQRDPGAALGLFSYLRTRP